MRFLIHGNAPHVKTGYGVQAAYLGDRLKADGHDVAFAANYGQQGGMGSWHGMKVYPTGYHPNSQDVLHEWAMDHFGGDPLGGWIITIIDVWVLENPLLKDFQVVSWTPVDHRPCPPKVTEYFQRTGAVPVAMARDGEQRLAERGLVATYIPLSVDTKRFFKPTPYLVNEDGSYRLDGNGERINARDFLDIPREAFCVGMVAMNKTWSRDRKGFNEALRSFGLFWRRHQDAVLYLHTEKYGALEGFNLAEFAIQANIPEHAVRWVHQPAYRLGFKPWDMAAAYTAMDVLLAPSHGEGFCVPLIEAQACGTPVIATDFTSQTELASPAYGAAGWLVEGQPEWDPTCHSNFLAPSIVDIVDKLEEAYAADLVEMQAKAIAFAQQYDTDAIYEQYWRPFIKTLEPAGALTADKPAIPTDRDAVAVIVPAMKRPQNVRPLVKSMIGDYEANIYFVCDDDDEKEIAAVEGAAAEHPNVRLLLSTRGRTFAQKVNSGYEQTSEPWLFICGDDVEATSGWIAAARELSDRYDIIGTNDTDGPEKNPEVAAGRHADHFFVRRSYVDEEGGCLDGPGVLAPEAYRHWFTDKEIVGLAKARGVFTPCLKSVVVHHQPGYDGREDLRQADPVYMIAVENVASDRETFMKRAPLIEMHRVSRAK